MEKYVRRIFLEQGRCKSPLSLRQPAGSRLMHMATPPRASDPPSPLHPVHRLLDDTGQPAERVRAHVGRRALTRHEVGQANLLGHNLNLNTPAFLTHLLSVADQTADTGGPGAHREALGTHQTEHKKASNQHENEGKNHDTHGQDSALRNAI